MASFAFFPRVRRDKATQSLPSLLYSQTTIVCGSEGASHGSHKSVTVLELERLIFISEAIDFFLIKHGIVTSSRRKSTECKRRWAFLAESLPQKPELIPTLYTPITAQHSRDTDKYTVYCGWHFPERCAIDFSITAGNDKSNNQLKAPLSIANTQRVSAGAFVSTQKTDDVRRGSRFRSHLSNQNIFSGQWLKQKHDTNSSLNIWFEIKVMSLIIYRRPFQWLQLERRKARALPFVSVIIPESGKADGQWMWNWMFTSPSIHLLVNINTQTIQHSPAVSPFLHATFPFRANMKRVTEGISDALFYSPVNQRGINVTHMQMVYVKCERFRFGTNFPSVAVKVRVRKGFCVNINMGSNDCVQCKKVRW